jgi:threonine synthase
MKPFNINETYLQCINCGIIADLLDERKFACPQCGGLFDVKHNRFPNDRRSLSGYAELFDSRAEQSQVCHDDSPLLRSGVWRFHEWIMPYLPTRDIVTLNEGNVPIVRAGKNLQKWIGPVELWMILEGITPTGSFKDFGGTVMISIA